MANEHLKVGGDLSARSGIGAAQYVVARPNHGRERHSKLLNITDTGRVADQRSATI